MRDLTEYYPKICDALRAHILEHFVERCDAYGCQDDNSIHEVSAQSYDGFIAHTNGGYRVLVHNDLSSVESEGLSDFESICLQSYIDSSHEDAASDFVSWRDELSDAFAASGIDSALDWLYQRFDDAETEHDTKRAQYLVDLLGDKVPQFWETDAGSEREDFYNYDSDYGSEGGTFFYEITALFYEKSHRRNVTGEDEIFIFAGINTDFDYGRERGLTTAFENTYKIARLTSERLRVIVETCANRVIG